MPTLNEIRERLDKQEQELNQQPLDFTPPINSNPIVSIDYNCMNDLKCPYCNETYLHHHTVEVFNCGEDADTGDHYIINSCDSGCDGIKGASMSYDSDITNNPSSRRQGIKIGFWCECCLGRFNLNIAQHKGASIMEWEVE